MPNDLFMRLRERAQASWIKLSLAARAALHRAGLWLLIGLAFLGAWQLGSIIAWWSDRPRSEPPASATAAEEANGRLVIPVQGVRAVDLRDSYRESRGRRTHHAIDIPAPRNTPVLAVDGGTVYQLAWSSLGGRTIEQLDSSRRYLYTYAHLQDYARGLGKGNLVQRGQVIGFVGTSGNAPPNVPHLHFAVNRLNPKEPEGRGEPINPYPLLVQ